MVDFLKTGDTLKILLTGSTKVVPNFDLKVDVVYEDDDLIVFDKPPFMPVHPSAGHQNDTLANVFCAHMESIGQTDAVFHPINRLDRDTSGLCVVAKHTYAANMLHKNLNKEYTAIICGELSKDSGVIDAPIKRLYENSMERCVAPDGKEAVTHFEVLKKENGYTLVKIKLDTGRTHQIRVHFQSIGHPLAGDTMYHGSTEHINYQALWCSRVHFMHPITKKSIDLCINIQKLYDFMHRLDNFE